MGLFDKMKESHAAKKVPAANNFVMKARSMNVRAKSN